MFRKIRKSYKPIEYPWAYEVYDMQSKMHWLPEEVTLNHDISQWRSRLTPAEKHLLTEVQLYLANADTDVASVYCDKYIPNLFLPEVRQMLITIASMEAIHMSSYALTIDQLGMPESSYSVFLEVGEMYEKHLFITAQRTEDLSDVQKFLLDIAIGSAFGEGLLLFSAFAIIFSFKRRGLMNGLGTLTKYIAMDEDLHCNAMSLVFRAIRDEHAEQMTDVLKQHIYNAARKAVELEDHFIDKAFQMGPIEGLPVNDLKQYIRYLANKRLQFLELDPVFTVKDNPFPWIDELISIPEHANFFEVRATSYGKVNYSGTWKGVWDKFKSGKFLEMFENRVNKRGD